MPRFESLFELLFVIGLVWLFLYHIVGPALQMYAQRREIRERCMAEDANVIGEHKFTTNDRLMAVDVQPSKPNYVFLSYNFRDMDVTQTPLDPQDFFDELWVQVKDIDRDQKWMYIRSVCTPKGLKRVMAEDGHKFTSANEFLFIRRYDLQLILNAVMHDIERQHREGEERAAETP